jgi:hypothetical protein
MDVGETVVFVNDVEGVEAGRHGRVMGLCDDTVMVGCRMRERLQYVLVHTWDVLPESMWRRLLGRRQIALAENLRCQNGTSKKQDHLVSQNVTPNERGAGERDHTLANSEDNPLEALVVPGSESEGADGDRRGLP